MTRRDARASRIPVGSQFSPNLISLSGFVAAAVDHSGDREALLEAVWRPGVRIRQPRKEPTKKRRSLPLEGAVKYGLLAEDTYEATPLAHELAAVGPPELFDRFARHILLNCGGLRVVDTGSGGLRRGTVRFGPEGLGAGEAESIEKDAYARSSGQRTRTSYPRTAGVI